MSVCSVLHILLFMSCHVFLLFYEPLFACWFKLIINTSCQGFFLVAVLWRWNSVITTTTTKKRSCLLSCCISFAKEAMWQLKLICLVSVCFINILKCCKCILMKCSGNVDHGSRTRWLHFTNDFWSSKCSLANIRPKGFWLTLKQPNMLRNLLLLLPFYAILQVYVTMCGEISCFAEGCAFLVLF